MKNRTIDNTDHWMTPPEFYNKLNKKYGFDFDPCPIHHDITKWDGLERDWGKMNFVNPGYSLSVKTEFVHKGIGQFKQKINSVFLLPVSTSTVLYHDYIKEFATKIEMIRGRLQFIGKNTKGQYVNYHLIQDVDNTERIVIIKKSVQWPYDKEEFLIDKYVKNTGQHDSMIVEFIKRRLYFFK